VKEMSLKKLLIQCVASMKARLVIFLVFFMVRPAYAFKLSGLASGWKSEMAGTLPIFLLGVTFVGVCTAGVAVISGIYAKKNQQPMQWQLYGLIGGGVAAVIPIVILAAAGSFSGEESGAESALSELGVKY
jgi:hypothetical protein